jgi:hypothetical protein
MSKSGRARAKTGTEPCLGTKNDKLPVRLNRIIVEKRDDVARYDRSRMIADVDSLHVKRIQLSGLPLFR